MTVERRKTKARVICNPTSGGGVGEPEKLGYWLEDFDVEWIETKKSGDACEAAREWTDGLLVVAGGDGTINEVVNGLGHAGFPEGVTLGLLPAGTGNDLAETLAVPADPEQAVRVLRENRVRRLDAARVRSEGVGEKYFVNVATGGLGAEISESAAPETKKKWGRLAYLVSSLESVRGYDPPEVHLFLDGEEKTTRAVNLAIGNCRYAGGGWPASPRANPEDGLLDLVVIEDVGVAEILALAPTALGDSDYLDKEGVLFARAENIRVESEPGSIEFTVDGEIIGDEPADFTVLPQTLKVIVGPEYDPETT